MNSTNVWATYEAALLAPTSTQPQGSQQDKIANAVTEALAPVEQADESLRNRFNDALQNLLDKRFAMTACDPIEKRGINRDRTCA